MKSRLLFFTVVCFFVTPLISQELYVEDQIMKLSDLAKIFQQKYDKNKLAAIKIAEERGMMIRYEDENGEVMEIQGLDENGNLIKNSEGEFLVYEFGVSVKPK